MVVKIIKLTGAILGSLAVLAALFYLVAYVSSEQRIHNVYKVTPQTIAVRYDSAALKLGARLAVAKGCKRCHGEDLGGKVFVNNAFGRFVAGNLTGGKGGLTGKYTYGDWVLALKHGIRKDGKPLFIMPADEFAKLTGRDMAAIVAYCVRLPKVDRVLPVSRVGPLGRVAAFLYREIPFLPAEKTDHGQRLIERPDTGVSVAHGRYIAVSCEGCHRGHMKGGPPIAPGFPAVVDITSAGNPGKWTAEQFIETLRTGKTPEGKVLNPKIMPWFMANAYTDTELRALHLYLKSL